MPHLSSLLESIAAQKCLFISYNRKNTENHKCVKPSTGDEIRDLRIHAGLCRFLCAASMYKTSPLLTPVHFVSRINQISAPSSLRGRRRQRHLPFVCASFQQWDFLHIAAPMIPKAKMATRWRFLRHHVAMRKIVWLHWLPWNVRLVRKARMAQMGG